MNRSFYRSPLTFGCVVLVLCLLSAEWQPLLWAAEETPGATNISLTNTTTDTISMSFDGAPLKDVLLLFSQQSGLNFIASQDVENKKVTVYFENVSIKDALDAIITANSLSYTKKQDSDIYVVYQVTKSAVVDSITKVIQLKYMRLSSSPLDIGGQVTIDELKQSAAPSNSSSSSSSGSSSSGSSSASGSSSSSGASSSDKGADRLVTKLLSPQGRLAVDTQSNSLIITDTPDRIAQIEKILDQLDAPPDQVVLEVYIMEVDKGLASDLGIEWGGSNGALGSITGGKQTTAFPFNSNFTKKEFEGLQTIFSGEFDDTLGITANNTASPQQVQYGLINASNFAATLHYIESDSDTKILARPRVLTQNNEAASIKVVTSQTIGVTTTSTDTGSATTTETGVPERTDVGVSMRMTPQINDDDSVLLFLEPSVTTVAASATFEFLAPTTRVVRTMARVKDNQTLVIGGLIDGNESLTKRKVPLLGDLPFVGNAFRYDAKDKTERELLIFVTPHIARGTSSLGKNSATSKGQDVALQRMLKNFEEDEMKRMADSFQDLEQTKEKFHSPDKELVKASEKRFANPVVSKQMSQALDMTAPTSPIKSGLLDTQMSQSLDSLTGKKYRS